MNNKPKKLRTYIMQYRTSNGAWKTLCDLKAYSAAGAIAQIASTLSNIDDYTLEISACERD